jgi:hypothetical protein
MHPWPRLINEVIPVAPSPAYVWIGGSWGWGGGRYNWRPALGHAATSRLRLA